MFSFKHGVTAVAKSLAALADGMGFKVSTYYDAHQVAVSNYKWNIMADLEEKYICSSDETGMPTLKICTSAEEVEQEFLDLMKLAATSVE